MCAMALVHSRIARVYFLNFNTNDGALVSKGVETNYLKNLNHQYIAFRLN